MSDTIEIVAQETLHLEITGVYSAADAIRQAENYVRDRSGCWALYSLAMDAVGVWRAEMTAVDELSQLASIRR